MLKPDWTGRHSNWICHVGGQNFQPSQGWKTHGNLPRRSGPPSQFQKSEAESSWGKIIPHPLPPSTSPGTMFLPDELSYQDVRQQPFLLTVAYAQGLQYWAEKLNPPENPDFHPLARSVTELRERVKEHVMFTKWDIIWGLGRVNLGATSQWPQTSWTSYRRMDPPLSPRPTPVGKQPVEQNKSFMEATTHTTPSHVWC